MNKCRCSSLAGKGLEDALGKARFEAAANAQSSGSKCIQILAVPVQFVPNDAAGIIGIAKERVRASGDSDWVNIGKQEPSARTKDACELCDRWL